MGYFTKTIRPDIINGAVANVIASNKTDNPFTAGDILFDWTAVDVPVRTNAIVDGIIHAYGEDGSNQVVGDIMLLVVQSNSGAAPTSLGTVNAGITGCYELPDILMNVMKFEGGASQAGKLDIGIHGSCYYWNIGSEHGQQGPLVIQPESNTLPGVSSKTRIWIAGIAGGAFDFSTGVLLNVAENVADDATKGLAVDGVDPRKAFREGDTVYIHDANTAIGTIASLGANTITLTDNNVGAITDDDEFMNASPITIKLSFSMKH